MPKIKITQVRSKIGATQRQKDTLRSIGLKKINHSVEKEVSDTLVGMVRKVSHLIKVEQV